MKKQSREETREYDGAQLFHEIKIDCFTEVAFEQRLKGGMK